MKIVFQDDNGKDIGSVEIDQSIVDAIKGETGIESKAIESAGDKDGKMSAMFAMKKQPKEEVDEEELNVKKPMKQKRAGLF